MPMKHHGSLSSSLNCILMRRFYLHGLMVCAWSCSGMANCVMRSMVHGRFTLSNDSWVKSFVKKGMACGVSEACKFSGRKLCVGLMHACFKSLILLCTHSLESLVTSYFICQILSWHQLSWWFCLFVCLFVVVVFVCYLLCALTMLNQFVPFLFLTRMKNVSAEYWCVCVCVCVCLGWGEGNTFFNGLTFISAVCL